jgi:predicted nuclease of restriction endonuclease-like RecB superfamily
VLTPAHTRAKRRGGELLLAPLSGQKRVRAVELAESVLSAARSAVGGTRKELDDALRAVRREPSEKKLVEGLAKLIVDAAQIEGEGEIDSVELRRTLFEQAALARKQLGPGEHLDRQRTIDAYAAERGLSSETVERGLYADLPSEEKLSSVPDWSGELLVAEYERAERQAVLLRAVRIVADVRHSRPEGYRALFQKLKFRRLLHSIERRDVGYRIEIDGPYSLFESVTKYGLALALILPELEAMDGLDLLAELRWGPRRERLAYRYQKRSSEGTVAPAAVAPEIQALLRAFGELDTPWRAALNEDVLSLPGAGVCIPDLVFRHTEDGRPVYLEVMGYWSRDAVFRRIELCESGLEERILFAVSSRLRVSEELLGDDSSGALYVYKGTMSARAVERHLNQLRRPVRA